MRRLAVVLHGDVAGYSRLMELDEAGTHARLMASRQLIDAALDKHGGRLIGTAGDAVLATFTSVTEGLTAAIAMQRAIAERNAGVPPEEQLLFRIGLNLGDVIVDGDDIFGTGVNVAARLEALAEPGGIVVAAAVRDQVGRQARCGFHRSRLVPRQEHRRADPGLRRCRRGGREPQSTTGSWPSKDMARGPGCDRGGSGSWRRGRAGPELAADRR